ncbi:MAG: helix-turn-helix domain-containing protein [Dehalococcoidia bacterium]|nr:helix-turn-helix domain-containing protein [Dehalococcoidia bacterium]
MKNGPGFVVEERPSDSPFVEKVWRSDSGDVGSFISVVNANWELVFTRQRGKTYVHLRGPETKPTLAECPEEAEFLGIEFKVGTFVPLLPTTRLVDAEMELPEAIAGSFRFGGDTWELPTFENADTFVAELVNEGLVARDPVVEAALGGHPPDLSPRTLQSHFRQATGLPYGAIRQILRAQQTVRLLRKGVPIPDVIHEGGYFDQAHLTHSLKRFIGQTPAQFVSAPAPISFF